MGDEEAACPPGLEGRADLTRPPRRTSPIGTANVRPRANENTPSVRGWGIVRSKAERQDSVRPGRDGGAPARWPGARSRWP
jgi:hypothetical protein